jgi:hypothetical protein
MTGVTDSTIHMRVPTLRTQLWIFHRPPPSQHHDEAHHPVYSFRQSHGSHYRCAHRFLIDSSRHSHHHDSPSFDRCLRYIDVHADQTYSSTIHTRRVSRVQGQHLLCEEWQMLEVQFDDSD